MEKIDNNSWWTGRRTEILELWFWSVDTSFDGDWSRQVGDYAKEKLVRWMIFDKLRQPRWKSLVDKRRLCFYLIF